MNRPFVQITFLSNFEIAPLFLFSNKNKTILHVLSMDVRSKMGWEGPRNVRRWKNGLRGEFDVRLSLSTEHYSKEKIIFEGILFDQWTTSRFMFVQLFDEYYIYRSKVCTYDLTVVCWEKISQIKKVSLLFLEIEFVGSPLLLSIV